MPATYPTEFKIKTIRRYEKGESIKTLSQELHIAQSTLYRWFQKYRTIQTPQRKYSPAEFDALLKRVKKAEHMLEIIRATECISAIPLQTRLQKLSTLYEQDTEFSVHEICEALEVSRGTFYNHIFRRVDRSKYQQEQKRLMQVVQQVFDDSNQRFGSEKIRITLAANGIHVSRERIQGIMQELDIQSIHCNAKREYKRRQSYRKRNLLNRNFTASKPNQIWVSDITYFKVKGYGLYLCVILDLFSRKVIAYNISRKASTYLVTSTFREAFALRNDPTLSAYISENDKTPSWDGQVFVYGSVEQKKSDGILVVPVQVKGTSKHLSAKSVSYSCEISDLRNYYQNGGCILFLVSVDLESQFHKIYYSSLQVYDLKKEFQIISIRKEMFRFQKGKSRNILSSGSLNS